MWGIGAEVGGWRAVWCAWRDRLLADPRFRARVAAFPLTRPIARRRARALFDLCAGFVYSQVLRAVVELGVLERLARGPCASAALAAAAALPPEAAHRLLRAAAALGLVEPRGADRWGLGRRGAELRGTPGLAALIAHHALLYADLLDPVALLRGPPSGTRLARFWPYATSPATEAPAPESVAPYSALMAATQPMVAAQLLDAYPFGRHRRLLDLGGGEGVFLEALAARWPRLELVLFDLPAVAERARARLARAGLDRRVVVVGGDFRCDPLPRGCDCVTLVRVLHDHDDATVRDLLRKVHTALVPGGVVVVAEPLAGVRGAEPLEAYFAFYLAAMGRGRPRRETELAALLHETGFARPRRHRTAVPLIAGVLAARRW